MNKTEWKKLEENEQYDAYKALEKEAAAANKKLEAAEKSAVEADNDYAQLEEDLAAANKANKVLEEAIVELNEKLSLVENAETSEEPTITLDETTYRIIGKVRVPAELREELDADILTPRQVAKSSKLAEYLLKNGSGQLVEVEPKEKV